MITRQSGSMGEDDVPGRGNGKGFMGGEIPASTKVERRPGGPKVRVRGVS